MEEGKNKNYPKKLKTQERRHRESPGYLSFYFLFFLFKQAVMSLRIFIKLIFIENKNYPHALCIVYV